MTIDYTVQDEQKVPKAYIKKNVFSPDAPPPEYPILGLDQLIEKTLKESAEAKAEPFVFDKPVGSVAVIGAGPAGLSAAKALKEHGLSVRIFERMEDVGGIWLYSDEPDIKPPVPCDTYATRKKQQPSAVPNEEQETKIVEATADERLNKLKHAPPSACYPDLHNNTAAPIMMDFEDFPWPEGTPYYVPHGEVQQYYKNYAKHFGLYDVMELNTSVEYVERRQQQTTKSKDDSKKWQLTLRKAEYIDNGSKVQSRTWTESFDAVAVASGAYNNPFLPDFPDLREYDARYPERIIHSKQYRHYQDYTGKNVLIVGANTSAIDIAQRLDGIASNVYMSIRGNFKSISPVLNLARSVLPDSTIHKPNIRAFSGPDGHVNGSITFEDDTVVEDIDNVIFCTGFVNDLGFLGPLRAYGVQLDEKEEEGPKQQHEGDDDRRPLVITNGSRPINTYRDIFTIRDPTLAFVGTPGHLTSTQFFYYQGQAVARVWAGLAWIPCYKKMRDHIKTNMYPFPPFDMNLLGCILHAQPFVTWLNDHAKYSSNMQLYKLKGVDPSLVNLWDGIKEEYKDRTIEILAKRNIPK